MVSFVSEVIIVDVGIEILTLLRHCSKMNISKPLELSMEFGKWEKISQYLTILPKTS